MQLWVNGKIALDFFFIRDAVFRRKPLESIKTFCIDKSFRPKTHKRGSSSKRWDWS